MPLVDFFKPCWRGRRAHRTTGCRSGSPAAPLCGYCAPRPGRPSALLRRRDEGAGTQAPTADRYRGLPLSDLERTRGAVTRVGRGARRCAIPVERNLRHAGLSRAASAGVWEGGALEAPCGVPPAELRLATPGELRSLRLPLKYRTSPEKAALGLLGEQGEPV